MVGGRLGCLMTPDTLLFGSAGYANAGLDDTNLRAGLDFGGQNVISESTVLFGSKRFSGVFVGGGAETRINDSLSLKTEYRYLDLGSENMTLLPSIAPEINEFVSTKFDPTIQMGRVSINYRFSGRDEPSAPLK
jgi:outer membrane immunogenic protein